MDAPFFAQFYLEFSQLSWFLQHSHQNIFFCCFDFTSNGWGFLIILSNEVSRFLFCRWCYFVAPPEVQELFECAMKLCLWWRYFWWDSYNFKALCFKAISRFGVHSNQDTFICMPWKSYMLQTRLIWAVFLNLLTNVICHVRKDYADAIYCYLMCDRGPRLLKNAPEMCNVSMCLSKLVVCRFSTAKKSLLALLKTKNEMIFFLTGDCEECFSHLNFF